MPRQIISRIPHKGMTAEPWGLVVENELIKIWTEAIPAAQRAALEKSGIGALDRPALARLDEIILQQAETLGWRITLSELVRFRMSEWDQSDDGPELFRKIGLAFARFARIVQRKELPPIEDPDHWAVKEETVKELRVVLRNLRAKFAIQSKKPAIDEVENSFAAIVADSPDSFRHLSASLKHWLKFFKENPHTLRSMTLDDRAKPASLYDEFFAATTGWEPESVRQTISRLKP